MANITAEDKKALALIMRAVIEHPDLVDDLAEASGLDISTDPEEMALQVIHAAVMSPKQFDSAVKNYASSNEMHNFGIAAIGGALLAAGKKVAGLFTSKSGSDETQGVISKVFSGIGDKIGDWKDRRQIKKDLKASGDPNWRQTWREMKPALKVAQEGGTDLSQLASQARPAGEEGGEGTMEGAETRLSDYADATGARIPEGYEDVVIPEGMTEADIKAGIALIEKQGKQIKLWRIIGISAGAAFVGALIWALTK